MAVAIDVGDFNDIHPKDKAPVGERLALAARAVAYGEPIAYTGPMLETIKFMEGKAILRFTGAEGGLAANGGGELKGFEIAGEDRQFVPARAELAGESVIAVSSPQVSRPAAVRYAWSNWPECNLICKAGLPASPFRTDDWPLEPVAQPIPEGQ
ncbi:MAG: hypothetical protein BWZ10_02677 [candidate division BRC1 bacterium ADurb.BinA364]|nr:MAG: hypothetical protein BWZ10_02677 [candidate division BRC1 bacterium ADurb.BinA364]